MPATLLFPDLVSGTFLIGPEDYYMPCQLPLCIGKPFCFFRKDSIYFWYAFNMQKEQAIAIKRDRLKRNSKSGMRADLLHCFWWQVSLTACSRPRGKLPWTAILVILRHGGRYMTTRTASTTSQGCLGETSSKTPKQIHSHPAVAVLSQAILKKAFVSKNSQTPI